jgi:hypothetical protein
MIKEKLAMGIPAPISSVSGTAIEKRRIHNCSKVKCSEIEISEFSHCAESIFARVYNLGGVQLIQLSIA